MRDDDDVKRLPYKKNGAPLSVKNRESVSVGCYLETYRQIGNCIQ